jgi:hypothetical protein
MKFPGSGRGFNYIFGIVKLSARLIFEPPLAEVLADVVPPAGRLLLNPRLHIGDQCQIQTYGKLTENHHSNFCSKFKILSSATAINPVAPQRS